MRSLKKKDRIRIHKKGVDSGEKTRLRLVCGYRWNDCGASWCNWTWVSQFDTMQHHDILVNWSKSQSVIPDDSEFDGGVNFFLL